MKSAEPPWYIMIGLLALAVGALITIVIWTVVILIFVSPILFVEWVYCKITKTDFNASGDPGGRWVWQSNSRSWRRR